MLIHVHHTIYSSEWEAEYGGMVVRLLLVSEVHKARCLLQCNKLLQNVLRSLKSAHRVRQLKWINTEVYSAADEGVGTDVVAASYCSGQIEYMNITYSAADKGVGTGVNVASYYSSQIGYINRTRQCKTCTTVTCMHTYF